MDLKFQKMSKQPLESLPVNSVETKDEDSSSQKALYFLKRLLCGQKGVQSEINLAVVSNTYYQLLEILHTVLLYSVFSQTNNSEYSLIQSIMGGFFFLVCLTPRLSKKHIIFQINFILYFLATIGSGIAMNVLFDNFFTFRFYCSQIKNFYQLEGITQYKAQNLCSTVYQLYIIEVVCQICILLLRFAYLLIAFRAALVAQAKYDEEEKKKRRRDRYNELLLKRNTYNEKRKV